MFVIVAIFAIHRYRPLTEEDIAAERSRLWIFKTHSQQTYGCVVCGDSRVYRGVSSSAIDRKLEGKDVFNFGYSSGSFSSFMLDRIEEKLDRDHERPILALGITPYSLTPRASKDEHFKQELARKKEEIIEALYLGPIKKIFQPVNLEPILRKKNNLIDTLPVYHQEPYYNQGWIASWKIPANPKAALAEYVKDFENNKVSGQMVDSLIARINKWTHDGIQVYGFRPPTTVEMVALENNLSGFDEASFVKRFEDAGGVWFNFSVTDFESYDGSHLTKASAIKFSEKLGELIQKQQSLRFAN
jgi:hypothetical protein